MPTKTYTYNPAAIGENGKDRMRFELGDTMVEGGAQTAALTDAEIGAVLEAYAGRWKRAKLALVESLCRRFAYEVDTDVGPLSLGLQGRVKAWLQMYGELKAEVGGYAVPRANPKAVSGAGYFYRGMMDNPTVGGRTKGGGGDVS